MAWPGFPAVSAVNGFDLGRLPALVALQSIHSTPEAELDLVAAVLAADLHVHAGRSVNRSDARRWSHGSPSLFSIPVILWRAEVRGESSTVRSCLRTPSGSHGDHRTETLSSPPPS